MSQKKEPKKPQPIRMSDEWKMEYQRLFRSLNQWIEAGRRAMRVPAGYQFNQETGDFVPPRKE